MEKKNRLEMIYNVILIGLLFGTAIGILKSILISSDIDEAYAVAQAYRWLQGDKLILNMWEPHQLSAYFCAFLMKIYLAIMGSTAGVVLYLRIMGSCLHFLLGIGLYKIVKKETSLQVGVLAFLLHMNYLAKWLTLPEFELMSYWYLLGAFLCAWICGKTKKNGLLLVLGALIFLQMLNYPTMIILYPIYLFGIAKYTGWSMKKSIYVTLGAAIPGVLFLAYLFSYMGMEELRTGLSYITADPSHMEVSFGYRMISFGKELLIDILMIFGGFVISYLLVFRKKEKKGRVLIAFLIELTAFEVVHILGCLLFDQNQFFMQERYLLACILGVVMLGMNKEVKNRSIWLYLGVFPTIGAVLSACLLSNMTLSVAYSKLFLNVIIVLICLFSDAGKLLMKSEVDTDKYMTDMEKYILSIPFVFIVVGLLVCKILLIRVTGCLPVTIKAPLEKITAGPAKGIYMLQDQATILNENYELVKENVHEEDRLFYFGCENLTYLYTDAQICTASVQGTSVFNQDFLDYFDLFPEKSPNVIALDKSFEMIEAYRYSPWNYIVKDWIFTQNYEEIVDSDYMTIYRLVK